MARNVIASVRRSGVVAMSTDSAARFAHARHFCLGSPECIRGRTLVHWQEFA